jgi:hypothetical protein
MVAQPRPAPAETQQRRQLPAAKRLFGGYGRDAAIEHAQCRAVTGVAYPGIGQLRVSTGVNRRQDA